MIKWVKFVGILAVVGVLALAVLGTVAFAGIALAQGPVDEDGDGIGEGFVRGWRGRGPYASDEDHPCGDFVDEDGDGICDIHPEGVPYGGGGRGWYGRGPHIDDEDHPCGNFVDEDGDGVCDNFADEDGDGICDIHLEGGHGGGRMGRHHRTQ